jgi:signal transduction histidine kinase
VDYGRGFTPVVLPGSEAQRAGNGLNNMKIRAMEMGGEINITSTLGQGTHMVLEVPLG